MPCPSNAELYLLLCKYVLILKSLFSEKSAILTGNHLHKVAKPNMRFTFWRIFTLYFQFCLFRRRRSVEQYSYGKGTLGGRGEGGF
jgi:hypothetical protein